MEESRLLSDPWRTPVVVAEAQCIESEEAVTPLDLLVKVTNESLTTATGMAKLIDQVHVVGILLGGGSGPATALCRSLHLDVACRFTTTIGGNTPQWLVGRAADDIVAGRARAVLIVGAEALRSQRLGPGEGAPEAGEVDRVEGDPRPGMSQIELAAGLGLPAHVYPLFESVLAQRAGRSSDQQRQWIGVLLEPFAAIAAEHPCAWRHEPLSAAEISSPSASNRVAAEPYTKRMNAFLNVDQAAAVVVTSLGHARELGIADGCTFVWSAGDANDVWNVSQRPDLGASPGIRAAGEAAIAAAGVGIDEIGRFDLYSCFPSAVQMAATALGLSVIDRRGLTVTGGLPYFGGPGNNYTTHAVATMAQRLRESGGIGLVSGLGWYSTKHSVGVYGSAPPPTGYRRGDTRTAQRAIDATALPVAAGVAGMERAKVEASTVIYDRAGIPTAAPVIARLRDGRRIVAGAVPDELAGLAGRLIVGADITVSGQPPLYRIAGTSRQDVAS